VCEEEPSLGLGGGLLAAPDGLLRALPRPRVRLGALAAHGEAAAMPDPAVRADLGQALDRLPAVAAEVALHPELGAGGVAELRDLLVREVADLLVGIELERANHLLRGRAADSVDVRQPDLEPLLRGQVDAGDACHQRLTPAVACAGGSCR